MNSRLIVFSFGDPGSINSEILTKALSIFEEKPHNAIIIGSLKSFKKFYNKNKELDLIEYFSEIDNKNKINTLSLLSNYRKKSFKIFIEKISMLSFMVYLT